MKKTGELYINKLISILIVLTMMVIYPISFCTEAKAADRYSGSITISFAGDCSLGSLSIHSYDNSFDQMYDKCGADYFFGNVREIFASDDMTLVNFEGVLTNSNDLVEKQYNIKGKPEYVNILKNSGIDAVTLGNNHRIDYGPQGVNDTLTALGSISMPYAYDDNVSVYTTKQGIKVGYVSVNEVYDKTLVEDFLQKGIAELKNRKVDLILACCHWGDESTHVVNDYQKELGHKCIDWGADIVVGCHPHVLQGIENYNGRYIIYSLGNFCFGGNKNPKNKDSMIVKTTFNFNNGKKTDNGTLQVVPCTISSVSTKNDFCPTPTSGTKSKSIIKKLNSYCKDFNVSVSSDGTVSIK